MATYQIDGTVIDWPEGTVEISVTVSTGSFLFEEGLVDMSNGQYSLLIEAGAGEKIWLRFFAGNFAPPPDGFITADASFGPFTVDDIGVLI